MLFPLDGPSAQTSVSVDTTTVQEVKVGGSVLSERKVITLQPLNGQIRVYFGDGVTTPVAATVASNGLLHFNKAKESYEASDSQPVYILAEAGTVNVIIIERA